MRGLRPTESMDTARLGAIAQHVLVPAVTLAEHDLTAPDQLQVPSSARIRDPVRVGGGVVDIVQLANRILVKDEFLVVHRTTGAPRSRSTPRSWRGGGATPAPGCTAGGRGASGGRASSGRASGANIATWAAT